MGELITKLIELPFWEKFADFHGFLAMLALVLFGAAFVLFFISGKLSSVINTFKTILTLLFLNILVLDIAGMSVYVPYRAATGGPRKLLLSSEDTAWLHQIVFEHKEFLAFAPLVLSFTALLVVIKLGDSFGDTAKFKWLRLAVFAALALSLIFVLTVAAEAVLVTKAAPVGK
ncbi:MAG: hypothetical protein Q8P13_01860 [bacterium]|nr:hypothetical protein [bacterium]